MIKKTVKSVKRKTSIPSHVYNLRIKDNHNYFANRILVHNCDDPNNALEGESEIKREGAIDWWTGVMPTRLNNAKTGVRVVVQQRLHESDISGYIMKNDIKNDWVKLILPMEFEKNRRSSTIILPSTNGKIWTDPRVEEGELLWPGMFGPEEVQKLKNDLGSEYKVSGQLQQNPSPAEGGIIKKNWFSWWKEQSPPHLLQIIQSWDTALEAGDTNAFSACTTWGVFNDDRYIPNIMLLGMWRGRLEYPELRSIAQRFYRDYRDDGSDPTFKPDGRHKPDLVLV